MSTRTRWLVGAAVCVVAVIAGATVVRVTEQEEPMLVEVPCDPDQFVDKSEVDTTVCYEGEAIEGATQQEEFTLMCNSYSAKNEADLRDPGGWPILRSRDPGHSGRSGVRDWDQAPA
jgi:hypothetical protein